MRKVLAVTLICLLGVGVVASISKAQSLEDIGASIVGPNVGSMWLQTKMQEGLMHREGLEARRTGIVTGGMDLISQVVDGLTTILNTSIETMYIPTFMESFGSMLNNMGISSITPINLL
jgi:hypothetical protein